MPRTATWFAPGRVNLIGEHTDYNDGFALPFALDRGCTATAAKVDGPGITITSEQKPTPVWTSELTPAAAWLRTSDGWAGYAAGVLWAAANRWGSPLGGWAINISSDLPTGAGLSSSAALCCSVAGAVAAVLQRESDADTIAELATVAEQQFVGAPTGGMDQLASAHGQDGYAVLCDMRDRSTTPIPFAPGAAGLALLVIDTGTAHAHVDGEYAQRRASCHEAATALGVRSLRDATLADLSRVSDKLLLRRARHVITENARVLEAAALLQAGDVSAIGPLLTASHVSMRDDFEITVERVDLAVETLLNAGALGARMTGGGFGGSVIGLVDLDHVGAAEGAVQSAFGVAGLPRPTSFLAQPSAGARPT